MKRDKKKPNQQGKTNKTAEKVRDKLNGEHEYCEEKRRKQKREKEDETRGWNIRKNEKYKRTETGKQRSIKKHT